MGKITQEVKELVRGTRDAVGSNFLGSLESFLVYLESLMAYCELFLEDSAAEAAMKARYCAPPACRCPREIKWRRSAGEGCPKYLVVA